VETSVRPDQQKNDETGDNFQRKHLCEKECTQGGYDALERSYEGKEDTRTTDLPFRDRPPYTDRDNGKKLDGEQETLHAVNPASPLPDLPC
jgi:hypothetical protein